MTSRLRIDLDALAGNYRKLREHAYADVAAVVKANGYGLGAIAVAQKLWSEQCRVFFVATAEEGVQLRQALAAADIYVLEGVLPASLDELVKHRLVPVLNTPQQCRTWAPTQAPAALHVDTGMQRLGLMPGDLADVLSAGRLNVELLVSHLARADEPEDHFNQQQLNLVRDVCQQIGAQFPKLRLSLTNSAGLLEGLGPEHLGRAGIALYGANPFAHKANPMRTVATLEAQVLQVRRVGAGIPVGYGGSFHTRRDSRIATLGVGYADGVPRLLSNCGRVYREARYFPIVGRVSMDMLHIEVTDAAVDEGDWFEVLGEHVTVDEVAAHAQTLGYEILTGLGPRPDRQYLDPLGL